MARKTVGCVFFDRRTRRIEGVVPIRVPTGNNILRNLTVVCNDHAWDEGYTHWVMPDTVSNPPRWMIFACEGRSRRVYLGEKPTREAAEMWLVSLG